MLPQADAQGRVYTTQGGVPVAWNAGLGYDALGRLCTTLAVAGTDRYAAGWRVDALGRVVVAAPAGLITFVAGIPFNANGSLAGQADTVPVASDPFVRGIRVGPGGAFGTSAAIP